MLELGSCMCNCLWPTSVLDMFIQNKSSRTSFWCVKRSPMHRLGSTRCARSKIFSRTRLRKARCVIHPVLTPGTKYLQLIRQAEHGMVECRLQEECATLTRFGTELRELDEVIRRSRRLLMWRSRSRSSTMKKPVTSRRRRTSRSSMNGSRRKPVSKRTSHGGCLR